MKHFLAWVGDARVFTRRKSIGHGPKGGPSRTGRSRVGAFPLASILTIALAVPRASWAVTDLSPASGDPYSGSSVLLSDLVSGAVSEIGVDHLVFTGFNYSPIGNMPAAANVSVFGFRDANGNAGLHVAGAFLDLPGGSIADALLRFSAGLDASATLQGLQFSGASLFLMGSGVGNNSSFDVSETFQENAQTLHVFDSTIPAPSQQFGDHADFTAPLSTLSVATDLLATAGATSSLPAQATAIDLSFTIPEPASLALLAIGAFALPRRKPLRHED